MLIACSIKTKNPEDSFKPEYIIPQLLTEAIRTKSPDRDGYPIFDGIKYPSTKIEYDNIPNNCNCYNYVFPVQEVKSDGYCGKLRAMFSNTKPKNLKNVTMTHHKSVSK